MKFVIFDKSGKILRAGHCQDRAAHRQTVEGEFIMQGVANDVRQKVVNGKIVDKSKEEIERDNPKSKPVSPGKRKAHITNEQLDSILRRIATLEARN